MKMKTSRVPLIGCSLFMKFVLIGPNLTVFTEWKHSWRHFEASKIQDSAELLLYSCAQLYRDMQIARHLTYTYWLGFQLTRWKGLGGRARWPCVHPELSTCKGPHPVRCSRFWQQRRGHYRRWRQHSGLRMLSNSDYVIYLTAASIFARLASSQMLLWKKQQRWAGCYSLDVVALINARTRGSHEIRLEARLRKTSRQSRMSHYLEA